MCDVTISLRIHPSLLAPHRNVLNSEGREEMDGIIRRLHLRTTFRFNMLHSIGSRSDLIEAAV